MDGTLVGANASQQSRVPRERLAEVAQLSRTVQEYLTELERQNPVADSEGSSQLQEKVSTTDPDATWAVKSGPATLGYYDSYLVDTTSRVILSVHATPARFSQEPLAARRVCLSMLASLEFTPRVWPPIRLTEAESFWRGCWSTTYSRISRSSIVATKPRDTSPESSSVTSPRKMRTTVRKENHCIIEVRGAPVRVISIAQRKRNAKGARRRTHVPEVPIADCLFIGKSQRDKQCASWQVRLNISAPNERATRSKPCSPNSSNR